MFYRVYRGQDGVMDYENVQATMDLDDEDVAIPDQVLPANTIWHYIRRLVSDCDLESADSDPAIVRIDSDGEMIPLTPNTPLSLQIEQLSGGRLQIRWRYTEINQEIVPTGFHIFIDSGEGFDFETPDDSVPYYFGGNGEFTWTSAALTDGQRYRFCVRSYVDHVLQTYSVTGDLNPGATGIYEYTGQYLDRDYFARTTGGWFLWFDATSANWIISEVLGNIGSRGWNSFGDEIEQSYSSYGTATGTPTVANAPYEESQNTNYVSIIAGSSGPPAATDLAATWEAD